MKNITEKLMLSVLAGIAFSACTNENEPMLNMPTEDSGHRIAVLASAGIGTEADTRLTMTDDEANKQVKISWEASGETFSVLQGTGKVTPVTFTQKAETLNGKEAIFEGTLTAGSATTCYAIYPALTANAECAAAEVTLDMSGQSIGLDDKKTYMYASQAYDGSAETVDFKFKHLTAIVKVTMTFPDGVSGNVSDIKFSGTNLHANATVDLTSGTLTPAETQTDIVLTGEVTISNNTATVYLHVLPAEVQNLKIYASAGGMKYTALIKQSATMAAGKVYNAAATMDKVAYVAPAGSEAAAMITAALQPDGTLVVTGTPESKDYTAFHGNSSIKTLDFSQATMTELPNQALCFYPTANTTLEKVVLPEGLTTINDYAFYGCEALEELNIPSTVKTLGSLMLYATKVKSVTIPDGVTVIPESCFLGCTTLETLVIPSTVKTLGSWMLEDTKVTSVTIPDGVTEIPWSCFYHSALTSIVIPASVTTIGAWAFEDVPLTTITIPETVISIGQGAFFSTYDSPIKTLTSVTINANITEIPADCFVYQNKLTTVSLSDGIKKIGNDAFTNCNISTLTLPASLEEIGERAFALNNITSLTIPDKVKSIGESAFNGNSIATIDLPASVTSLHTVAFPWDKANVVICRAASVPDMPTKTYNPETGEETNTYSMFNNQSSGCELKVPAASVETYKTAWGSYFKSVSAITE